MDRFIVGTGRCGSTLLSRMLGENPEVLSIFEFFNGLDVFRRFSSEPVSGAGFAGLIGAEQPVVTAVLRRGYDVAEITYPFGRGGRFRRGDPLPWILVSALPRLSDDPDALFDETIAWANARPSARLERHYRDLFDWWSERQGRPCWVERSGSSIDYVDDLLRFFPAARFLHIHRDGPEAALSMREHHAYRLPIALLYGAAAGGAVGVSPAALRAPPTADDPITRILASRPPVAWYGRYWSDQVVRGARALRDLDASRVRELRFEELLARPAEVMGELCDFFELTAGAWIARAAALVRGAPPTRVDGLSAADREVLEQACRPGRELLHRA